MKQMVVKAALMAVQIGLSMLQKIEGPRLDSLEVTTADYGTPLTYFWGIRRIDGCPIFWAEKLREKKTTQKTKGGKYADYKYFGTFAVAIADHEIDKVSRIWMDKHLVFDMTSDGPISPLAGLLQGLRGPVKLVNGRNMRIYLGTETQAPDPRMVDWCEDRYGADSCPAYKGVAYIVFQNIPLEKFGNRIPQISVEAVNNSNTQYLWAEEPMDGGSAEISYSPGYDRFFADGSIWDTATRTRLTNIDFTPQDLGNGEFVWDVQDGGFVLYTNNGLSGGTAIPFPSGGSSNMRVFTLPQGWDLAVALPIDGFSTGIVTCTADPATEVINPPFTANHVAQDWNGDVWVAGRVSGVDEVHLLCVYGSRLGDTHSFATLSDARPRLYFNTRNEFVVEQNGVFWRLDEDFTPLQSASLTSTGTFSHAQGSNSVWRVTSSAINEIDISNLTSVRTISGSNWVGAGSVDEGEYDPVNHAIVSRPSGKLTFRFLDRVGSDGTQLADVVLDVADRCGVTSVDVADLDQNVPGYSVTQGSGKDWISPLLDIHDVDARPHGFEVQFLSRGSSSAGTIAVSEFVREGDEARYRIITAQDTDLPAKIMLTFSDVDADQQVNTVIAQRPLDVADSVRVQTIDLGTYAATAGDAQKFADRYQRRKWNGRHTVENSLTAQYLKLEPGDVYNLQLDDVVQSVRLKKMTVSGGRLNLEWERDFPSLALLGTGAGAAMEGRDPDEVFVPSPTKGFVLDIPLTDDAQELSIPQLHYGAGDYGTGNWPGAIVYEGDTDENEYFPWNTVEAADKAGWGFATDVLGDANPNCWDRGNSVNINYKGTLTSSTEAAVLADPALNMAVIGSQGAYEIIQFVTATLEADGTYTLSTLRRGRRGTEWACSEHALGDEFILVADLDLDGRGLSDVGLDLTFKAQTVGRDLDSATLIEVDFTGATLKPYAPARLKWTFDGTDLDGEIIRRTRVGGDWVGGSTISLGESSEAYEVDIYNGATFKRTITVSGTNTFSYTAAMAAADGITLPTPPTAYVYQVSSAVGRGFALAA